MTGSANCRAPTDDAVGYVLFDEHAGVRDGNVLFAKACGQSIDNLRAKSARDLPFAQAAELGRAVRSVARTGRAVLGMEVTNISRGGLAEGSRHRIDLYPGEGGRNVIAILSPADDTRLQTLAEFGQSLIESALFVCLLTPEGALVDLRAGASIGSPFANGFLPGRPVWESPWWADDAASQLKVKGAVTAAARQGRSEGDACFEVDLRLNPERVLPTECRIVARRDDEGGVRHLVLIAHDLTQRKAEQARQVLLTAELDHRIKNMLSVIQAMIGQTARYSKSTEDLVAGLQGRVHMMSEVHGLLMRSGGGLVNLRDLMVREIRSIVADPLVCEILGPPVLLAARAATSVSLVIHELTTNAVKYGALSGPGGYLRIEWALSCDGPGADLLVSWVETAPQPIAPPVHTGFGTHLISQTVRNELGGRAEFRYPPDGLRCTVTLPLARLQDAAPL